MLFPPSGGVLTDGTRSYYPRYSERPTGEGTLHRGRPGRTRPDGDAPETGCGFVAPLESEGRPRCADDDHEKTPVKTSL